jgi:hypothetical protein
LELRSRLRLNYGGRSSRSRLEYAVNFGVEFGVEFGVKYGVERSRMRLEFSVEKLKFEAWIQY